MSICNKCERESECLVAYGDDFCFSYVRKSQTNADRIRAMTDEKLACLLNHVETDGRVYGPQGEAYWRKWLKQEATR